MNVWTLGITWLSSVSVVGQLSYVSPRGPLAPQRPGGQLFSDPHSLWRAPQHCFSTSLFLPSLVLLGKALASLTGLGWFLTRLAPT